MSIFIIEAVVLCLVFTLSCFALVDGTIKNPERAKLSYPEPIIQRLIELGKVSGDRPLTLIERIKKKWPAIILLGVIIGVVVRYVNKCTTFISAFAISYLLWLIVDWYDALILDCLWFCHSKRCIIPGTEDLVDAYHYYMFHINGSAVGMLIGLPTCLISGLVALILA